METNWGASEGRRARRAIARINFMAQDRPDLSAAARVVSQHMSSPTTGTMEAVKRIIRYIKKYPKCVQNIENYNEDIICLVDSDWAGDVSTRKSCSGGVVLVHGAVVGFWSKLQSNVALSSAEAELNASVKGLSEMMGVCHLYQEFFGCEPACRLFTDASACKGMLLRQGSGKIKHLSTKQLWAQGAIQSYGISVEKIPRALNAADALTHSLTVKEMATHLKCLGFTRP